MKVEIKIDSAAVEPKVLIITDRMTDEINEIVRKISETEPQMIAGVVDDRVTLLEQDEILRVYATNGKIFAVTAEGEFPLRMRLYQLEERLRQDSFVRISNSEIINLKKARHFDLSFTGTICVSLSDGSVSYVSRRYVSKIKQILGL